MPRLKRFSRGYLCRPILHYRKKDILAYARQHRLEWIEDESNYEQRFDRNFLRHSIFPLLQARWPSVMDNFARSAELQTESQQLLEEMAEEDMHDVLVYNQADECETDKLLTQALLALRSKYHDDIRLKNILRYWISINHVPLPSRKILQEIITAVLYAGEYADPRVCWNRDDLHGEVRKYRNKLYLLNSPPDEIKMAPQQNVLTLDHPLILDGNRGRIILQATSDKPPNDHTDHQKTANQQSTAVRGFDKQRLLSRPVSIVFRQGGERYRRSAKDCSHSLKHWFQEQAVPPWERQSMPLVYWGDDLIQVGERVVNFSLISSDAENSLVIRWITDK